MKADESMLTILAFCKKIDGKAAAIYHYFSINEKDPGLKDFWKKCQRRKRAMSGPGKCFQTWLSKAAYNRYLKTPWNCKTTLNPFYPCWAHILKKAKAG